MSRWRTLTFRYGSEWAPDSAFGLDILRLRPDGRYHYENRIRGEMRRSAGEVDAGRVEDMEQWLRTAGFPVVPPQSIPPGSSMVEFVVDDETGSHTVRLLHSSALGLPGYGDLVRSLEAWATSLREGLPI
jgi:hypothetical protein